MAGGIADWLNAPVASVRVFLVFALLFLPPVKWAYMAAAALIPPRGRSRPGWDNLVVLGRLVVLLGVPALVVGESIILNEVVDDPGGYWIALLGLQVVGAALLFSFDYLRKRPRTEAEQRSVVLAALPVGVVVAALVAGVLLIADVRWERLLPLVVVVAGVALLAAAYTGRARPFIGPAVVAVGITVTLTAADTRLEGGVGDVQIVKSRASREPIVVRRAVGDVDVDLRRLRSSRPIRLEASVGQGTLRIALPGQARVLVDARVGQGSIRAWPMNLPSGGADATGFGRHVSVQWPPGSRKVPPAATIQVSAAVGMGEIQVTRGRDALAAR